MNFFIQNEKILHYVALGMGYSTMICLCIYVGILTLSNKRKSRYIRIAAILTIIYTPLTGILIYNSEKFVNQKTEELLKISSNEEINVILKDVPTKFINKIYDKLREKRVRNNPVVEIEEILEKILQEKNN